MVRGRNITRGPPRRVEFDITSIISVDQKNQLQTLVDALMEKMHQRIRDGFEELGGRKTEIHDTIQPPIAMCFSLPHQPLEKHEDQRNGKVDSTACSSNVQDLNPSLEFKQPLTIPKSVEDATLLSRKTEQELLAASVAELKRDAITHFGKWRANVQRRVSDMVVRGTGTAGIPASQGLQQAPGGVRHPGMGGRGRGSKSVGKSPLSAPC
jgi:hypothetical protein